MATEKIVELELELAPLLERMAGQLLTCTDHVNALYIRMQEAEERIKNLEEKFNDREQ